MPLMDEFQEERAEIKNKSFKEKCSYYWYYYKWHVIVGAILIFSAISLIHTFLDRKETAFYLVMMNMTPTELSEDYRLGFSARVGIDPEEYNVFFDTNMFLDPDKMDEVTVATSQKIMMYLSAGDLDAMITDLAGMNRYAYNGVLTDLRDFLTDEEYARYEPYFFYLDRTLLSDSDTAGSEFTFPEDPCDPTAMKDPVPVGIRLDECIEINRVYRCENPHYFCIFGNTSRQELIHSLLDYIWDAPAAE